MLNLTQSQSLLYMASLTSPAFTGRTECCSMLGYWHPMVWPHHFGLAVTTLVTTATASGL